MFPLSPRVTGKPLLPTFAYVRRSPPTRASFAAHARVMVHSRPHRALPGQSTVVLASDATRQAARTPLPFASTVTPGSPSP